MAARRVCLLGRCASLLRSNQLKKTISVRNQSNQSIWTMFKKVREPPNGFLFNEKPRKPGEKRQWEDWEGIWYRWWAIIIVTVGLLQYYKPDTSYGTWAHQEALKQLTEKEA